LGARRRLIARLGKSIVSLESGVTGFWVAVFWFSVLTIGYAYIGYPIIVTVLARLFARPVRRGDVTPTITLLVAAYNEEKWIGRKLENGLSLNYPSDRLEILVVADGSSDGTEDIVSRFGDPRVRLAYRPERQGKTAALNRAVPLARGEVIVFSDANTFFESDALRKLVRNFADPEIGCVAGAKEVRAQGASPAAVGEGLYWRYENHLKRCDSAIGSVVGAPGEIFAVRRELWMPLEEDTLLDDFVLSLRLVERGWRAVYEPEAVTWEEASPDLRGEWTRRTRNVAGGFQAFARLPGMLDPRKGLVAFQYLSHRMLRWLLTPSLWVLMLVSNLALFRYPLYRWTLAAQALFYALAVAGYVAARRGVRMRWLQMPFYVCLLNAAALVGGFRYIAGRQSVLWRKARS
jgi:biofilm PGA synthesis N-glycosyltransferase PgaC